jgi:membrane protease YdiL (CAAX protease family)
VDPKDRARHARTAILVTCALYVGYGIFRIIPGVEGIAGVLLVAGFYFLPGWMLRKQPELAREYQVGPDIPVPRWSWRGAKVAAIACAIIFPPFVLCSFFFYQRVCQGDLTFVAPAVWVESMTPWEGSLARFLGKLCTSHGGGYWPDALHIPQKWKAYAGFGWLYEIVVGLFAIALPEEVFHRGYLMSALEKRWPAKRKLLGTPFGVAALLSSLLFAVGHIIGMAETVRLATFFPALIFAWLWRRSGSLWAPALFHTASNLLMDVFLASTFPPQ